MFKFLRNMWPYANEKQAVRDMAGFPPVNYDHPHAIPSQRRETVCALPAFKKGIDLIAGAGMRCGAKTYKRLPQSGKARDYKHKVEKLLNWEASPGVPSCDLIFTWFANALWSGDGYVAIERNEKNFDPEALYNLDPETVHVTALHNGVKIFEIVYTIKTPNGHVTLSAHDVLHLKHTPTGQGIKGLSICQIFKNTLDLGTSLKNYSCLYFHNSTHMSKWIEYPAWLEPEQAEQLKESITKFKKGINNAHELGFLQGNMQLKTAAPNNEEAQFLGTVEANAVEIANILNLKASHVNSRINSSYGAEKENNLDLLNSCFDVWFKRAEAQLNTKLLWEYERETHYIQFDRNELFANDPQLQRENTIAYFTAKLKSWEESRDVLDMNHDKDQTWGDPSPQPVVLPMAEEAPKQIGFAAANEKAPETKEDKTNE